ncbi:MAG: hypothetical protein WBZ24_10875 [Anaerolineales bacterium]
MAANPPSLANDPWDFQSFVHALGWPLRRNRTPNLLRRSAVAVSEQWSGDLRQCPA